MQRSIPTSLRTFLACLAMLAWLAANTNAAAPKEFRFPIDGYELSFSVPKAFLSDEWPGLEPDKKGPELIIGHLGEGTAAIFFSHPHMFAGPIWVGNYASMDFTVLIREVDSADTEPVSSLEQLEEHKKRKLARPNSYDGPYEFSRKIITGETWLMMTLIENDTVIIRGNTRSPGKRGDENTVLCFPLGDHRYLQIYCRITEYVPNKTGRWLSDAHKMRDQILDSVVLRKKTN